MGETTSRDPKMVPNPEALYWVEVGGKRRPLSATEWLEAAADGLGLVVRSSGTSAPEAVERAWFVGCDAWTEASDGWTEKPEELLGYWVRRVGSDGGGTWLCSKEADKKSDGWECWWPELKRWHLVSSHARELLEARQRTTALTLPK